MLFSVLLCSQSSTSNVTTRPSKYPQVKDGKVNLLNQNLLMDVLDIVKRRGIFQGIAFT